MIERLRNLDIRRLSIIQYIYILALISRVYSGVINLLKGCFRFIAVDILAVVVILYALSLDVNKVNKSEGDI